MANLWCTGRSQLPSLAQYCVPLTAGLPSVACMQTMFRYIPCRLIPYPARCAGNQVHPNIFNTTKHNGPGGTGRESGGASDLFTDTLALPSGLSSVGPRGNIHLGTVSIPGWSSVPPRLLRKISSLEFVDMWELLLES